MNPLDLKATAVELHKRGLATAVLFALEVGRPFTLLGGQLLWVAQPTLGLFGAADWASRWARVLEDSTAVAQLQQLLLTEDGGQRTEEVVG